MPENQAELRLLVHELNGEIRKLNRMGTNVIPTTLSVFDEADVLTRWRRRRQDASGEGVSHADDNATDPV
ncbi:MAG: hypothetical protein JXQ73_07360 [Phycisphaerae bacterium]|nr:hypothetical protein [Phycisphaerae bacterium]